MQGSKYCCNLRSLFIIPQYAIALFKSAFVTNVTSSIKNIKTFVTNVLTFVINAKPFIKNIKTFVTNVLTGVTIEKYCSSSGLLLGANAENESVIEFTLLSSMHSFKLNCFENLPLETVEHS
jgi:hypothetical protein